MFPVRVIWTVAAWFAPARPPVIAPATRALLLIVCFMIRVCRSAGAGGELVGRKPKRGGTCLRASRTRSGLSVAKVKAKCEENRREGQPHFPRQPKRPSYFSPVVMLTSISVDPSFSRIATMSRGYGRRRNPLGGCNCRWWAFRRRSRRGAHAPPRVPGCALAARWPESRDGAELCCEVPRDHNVQAVIPAMSPNSARGGACDPHVCCVRSI